LGGGRDQESVRGPDGGGKGGGVTQIPHWGCRPRHALLSFQNLKVNAQGVGQREKLTTSKASKRGASKKGGND